MFYNSSTYRIGYVCGYVYCFIGIPLYFFFRILAHTSPGNWGLVFIFAGVYLLALLFSVTLLVIGILTFIFERKLEKKEKEENILIRIINTIMFIVYLLVPFILFCPLISPKIMILGN